MLELTGMDESAIKAGFVKADGSASHCVGMLLYALAKAASPQRLLEVGYNEYATAMLVAGAASGESNTKVVSIGKRGVSNRFVSFLNPFPTIHNLIIGDPSKLLPKALATLQGSPDFVFFNTNEHWDLYYEIASQGATIISLEPPPLGFINFSKLHIGKKA